MPADRFYLDGDLVNGSTVMIEGNEFHHLSHVMRLRVGDVVEVVNGKGWIAKGKVAEIGKKEGAVKIDSAVYAAEPRPRFLLAVPIMRSSKLEWVVEKGTELGASAFLFYGAVHSETEELSENKIERLRTVAIAALKQSGRLYLPGFEIHPALSALFGREARFLFGDPRARGEFEFESLKGTPEIVFITGPEQGFASEEIGVLDKRAEGVRLSGNVLRAETAPLVAACLLGLLI